MIKVGPDAFVVPGTVVAIVWDTYTECMPHILLSGGHGVRAEDYKKRGATDEEKQEIILKLWSDLQAPALEAMRQANSRAIEGVEASRTAIQAMRDYHKL